MKQDQNKDCALVLWIEMLGYRSWLQRQTDLASAEAQLLKAVEVMFESTEAKEFRLQLLGLRVTLISDTIIIWSHRWHFHTWVGMHIAYQVLATKLAFMGLPVRGALAYGSFRLREKNPRILLGEAIVFCAGLERTIKAFVVVVDDSVVHAIAAMRDEQEKMLFRNALSIATVPTSDGDKRLFVMNWMLPTVPHALHVMYRGLVRDFEAGERAAVLDLMNFIPKFLNSRHMIQTLWKPDDFREQAEHEWAESLAHAESLLPKVYERADQEIERMRSEDNARTSQPSVGYGSQVRRT